MKRLSLLLLALCVMGGAANAQKKPFRDGDVFSKGDVVLNLGIGLGNMVYNDSYTKKVPPISLSGEYAVTGNLFNNGRGVVGLGAYIGYTGAKYRAFDNLDAGWNFNNLVLGVRGALHYQFVNRLDTYLGLFLGYNITMTNDYGSFPSGLRPSAPAVGGFEFAFYVGARYYLTQRFAVFGEVGYGLATVNLGLAYKF